MAAIPAIAELQALPQWVCWRFEIPKGRTEKTKVPYTPYGQHAKTNAPRTWSTYQTVDAARIRFDGVGLVLAKDDPYTGIDIDNCIDEEGVVADWALKEVERLHSYTEITPSGRGLRIWVKGRIPEGRGRKKHSSPHQGFEVNDRTRFFTVTGRHFAGSPDRIEERQAELDAFMAEHFPPDPPPAPPAKPRTPILLSDQEILDKAFAAANGHKVRQLYDGHWKVLGYDSQSEADLALCSLLRFWTGGDEVAMDRLFRQSGLMREKWDEKRGNSTWGRDTLKKALQGNSDVYHAPSGDLPRNPAENPRDKSEPFFVPENPSEEAILGLPRLPRKRGEIIKPDAWPAPLAEEAFFGLAGDFVRAIEPHTEADPAALLLSFLCSAGNLMGLGPHMRVGPKIHRLREFVALVGMTGSGRKGTSIDFSLELMKLVDPYWRWEGGGLSSGEGLIWMVRDAITKMVPIKDKGKITDYQHEIIDEGVSDKRRLVVEEEFATVLKAAGREGNTLSGILRQVWDRDDVQSLTKNSPAKATGAHVSCIVHITPDELRRNLSEVEVANGFANRFLWVCSMRSRFLPHGGEQVNLQFLADEFLEVLRLTHMHACELSRNEQACAVWKAVYPELTMDWPGMLGAVTSRAEAHVLRLSGIYAALDGGKEIRLPHLLAALAVWDYCAASARYLFGDRTGEPVADTLLVALREVAPAGLARNAVREEVFQRNVASERIEAAIEALEVLGQVVAEKESTGGRPRQMLYSTGGQKGRAGGVLGIAKEVSAEL